MLPAGQNHPRNRMSHWRPLEFLVHKTQLNNKKVGSDWNYAMFMCQSIRASGYGFPLVDGKINAKLPTSEVHVLFIRAKFKWGHKLTTVDRRHQSWYLFFPSWNIRTEDWPWYLFFPFWNILPFHESSTRNYQQPLQNKIPSQCPLGLPLSSSIHHTVFI